MPVMMAVGVSISALWAPAIMSRLTALFSGSINLKKKKQIKGNDSPSIMKELIIIDHDLIHHS